MTEIGAQPFMKWAGGKGQLPEQIKTRLPEHFNEYMEPFVSGGVVYSDLQSEKSIINDINEPLTNVYLQIKVSSEEFANAISEYDKRVVDGGKEYYYKVREDYNDKVMRAEYGVELAILFVFLNKHCFNGLYRVNGRGPFNVPYDNSVRESYSKESIVVVSQGLQEMKTVKDGFQNTCDLAEKDDFVSIGNPCAPLNPTSFKSYIKEGSDVENHRRPADMFRELIERGRYCMLTNHNTDFVNQLYTGFNKAVVDVKHMISPDAKNWVGQETIITDYQRYIYGGADVGKDPGILRDWYKKALSGRLS